MLVSIHIFRCQRKLKHSIEHARYGDYGFALTAAKLALASANNAGCKRHKATALRFCNWLRIEMRS